MANRTKVLETLKMYFEKKGRVLSPQEYSRETDTPIRIQQVRNIFGSWNKLEKLLMARESRVDTDAITDVNEVLAARNKALYDEAAQWRAASENQDAKALREAEAQHVAEVLARNAATAAGANANKLAIGGPLPSEQPQLHRIGATVKVDPVTREQVVVDTKPDLVEVAQAGNPEDGGMTPVELRDAVAAQGVESNGSVAVGHATDGGSQGTASIATVAALDDKEETPAKVTTEAKK